MNDLEHSAPREWPDGVPSAEQSASRVWLVTFTDLVSLMLTFFVMLFAMSNVRLNDWENVIDSLSQTLRPSQEKTVATSATYNIGTVLRKSAINLDYLDSVFSKAVGDIEALSESRVVRLEDRLVIALPGELVFEAGGAVLTGRAREALFVLGGVLRNIGNQVFINGHTDPTPPSGIEYLSNWELSTARAIAVANALTEAGYTDDITAFGFSDGRYDDLSDLPEAERRVMGRRVDIVVLPTGGDI